MTSYEYFEAVSLMLRLQMLVSAADEHDPDFSGLLDSALAQDQLDANEALAGLVWMASTEHRAH